MSDFPIEPWQVREHGLDLDRLARSESVFALSNGHIGLRGNLDEGEPFGIPGTYLNSFYELRPLPYAEVAYGYPESSQTVANVTNGKLIRLLVNDSPFDVRYGRLLEHERVLDFRAGTLTRYADWESPAGHRVRVRSTRLVSLTQRAIAAIEYSVEAVDGPVRLVVQSELVANEPTPTRSGDPRVAAALDHPLDAIAQEVRDDGATLVHRTRVSGLLMAASMNHLVEAPGPVNVDTSSADHWARTTFVCTLAPGQRLRLVKLLAYGWSGLRSESALCDQVAAALTRARHTGFDGLRAEQRSYLDDYWAGADVVVEGDPQLQQSVRFALFHVLQAAARAERRCLPAKGLTGPGYDGHTFWDTEAYLLPMLVFVQPHTVADALRWRHSTLDLARERAAALGLRGAAFPWRTIRGQECSGYWPAGTAAFHVNADIAAAVALYRAVTGDETLEAEAGLELLAETSRLWMSLGHHDSDGVWHITGVTGPDEYTAIINDNLFTNLAAAHNLRDAADAAQRHPDRARDLGITPAEIAAWRAAAEAVHVPYDGRLRVHQQSEGFTRLPEWDFDASREKYPLLLHAPYFDLYRKQVVKQADLLLAQYWFGHLFDDDDKARNVDYYERRTVRDSSLSAAIQAVTAAEVGHLGLAYDYTYEAAQIDLLDIDHNSGDGLHIASLAGVWTALVAGFGGLRHRDGVLCLAPQLPVGIHRLAFTVRWRGMRLGVDIDPQRVTYTLHDGPDGPDATLSLRHNGRTVTVSTAEPAVETLIRRRPLLPRPAQPPGRRPRAHRSWLDQPAS
ncbi:glycoside hydrolase family 65 protein [Allorhizocola rhizosphaerae]|uniref:glycoside hydrolase family 65 protein n=1 Tax=Allorhizocola rhizosphaerae TaxID=1872709 RepID=UPI000E3B70CB